VCNSEGTPEMNLGVIIALDIGGTTVKSVLCDFEGRLLSNIDYTPIDSRGSRSTILNVFSKIVIDLLAKADEMGSQPSGLVLAFPGPFDYERGICLIKGVGKYEALYGIDIKSFFRDEVLANRIPVFFDADSWAFTRGQCLEGAARGAKRVIGLTIGTGLGSAFVEDGRIIENERGVPPYGWIGFLPCGKGILDDRISRRGILARYREFSNSSTGNLDVKDLFELALKNDPLCVELFRETGSFLGKALVPFVELFQPDLIVIGGEISGAFDFIAPSLKEELEKALKVPGIPGLPGVLKATDPERCTLSGLALYFVERYMRGGNV